MDQGLDGDCTSVSLPGAVKRLRQQQVTLLWLLPILFLGVFFFLPLGAVFRLAGEMALERGLVLDWLEVWRPLRFTFWQAGLSTVLTLTFGLPAAYIIGRFTFPGKAWVRIMTTLPFILPTVVVAASFNALLGPRGWLNALLMHWLALPSAPIQFTNSLGAILLAHIFYNTTVVIWVVGAAWSQLDLRLEQAGRILGASAGRTLWEVTFPLLRKPILGAALLVFLFDFTSFGVILLLGGPYFATLEVAIYIQAMQMLNMPLAGLLSAIQLLCTLLVTGIHNRLSGHREAIPLAPRLKGEGVRRPRTRGEILFIGLVLLLLLALLVLPLLALISRSFTNIETGFWTLDYYRELFINRRQSLFYVPPVLALRNSLVYAGVTVIISLALGMLAAIALNRRALANRWLDALLMLPLGSSAVTLGLGFLVVFNRPPLDVRSFPWLVPIAHSLVALPFVVRTLHPALASIPQRLRQAAMVLGASPGRAWREVDFPIIARAALVAAIFSFAISLGEFGATSFLARPEYPTLPVAIFRFLSQPGELNYGQALAMATLLMTVCTASIVVLEQINKIQE